MDFTSSSSMQGMRPPSRDTDRDDDASLTSSSSDANGPVNLSADAEWQDIEPDDEHVQIASFFDDQIFENVEKMLAYTAEKYRVDVVGAIHRLELDFYDCIKMVNYLRAEARAGNGPPVLDSKSRFDDDRYLQPVLEDDTVLFSIDDILELAGKVDPGNQEDGTIVELKKLRDTGPTRVAQLEEQLALLQTQFAQYRGLVERTLEEHWSDKDTGSGGEPAPVVTPRRGPRQLDLKQDDDSYYFNSYAYNTIHETMLKDTIRTSAYRDFIYSQKHLFAGKTVLDVGCGTGILSMFCAKAGAARVFAVDNSNIISKAREIVAQNGLQDTILCVRGKVEEVELLYPTQPNRPRVADQGGGGTTPNATSTSTSTPTNPASTSQPIPPSNKVDILVSEWMGYCLLFESMLDSVICARDTHLNPTTGLMVPSHCTLHIAPVADPDYVADTVDFWHDVYGFDMGSMVDASLYEDIIVRTPPVDAFPGQSAVFRTLELRTVRQEELSWEAEQAQFEVTLDKDVDALDAWCVWFDTFFLPGVGQSLPAGARAEKWPKDDDRAGIAFTTGPGGKETHWYTGVLMVDHGAKKPSVNGEDGPKNGELDGDLQKQKQKHKHRSKGRPVPLAKGQTIKGCVGYKKRTNNARELEIEVRWHAPGTEEQGRQVWILR